MASLIPKFLKKAFIDSLVAQNLYLMLLTADHVPNASTQRYISDVSANEIEDSGGVYVPGGVLLSGKAQQYDPDLPGNSFIDATDLSIGPGASITYRWGVLYNNTGNPATSEIKGHVDFGEEQSVTNGTSLIQWNALGIIYSK